MEKSSMYIFVLMLTLLSTVVDSSYSQSTFGKKVTVGAYYFDGWKASSRIITKSLKTEYSEREPIWGWVTSTQSTVDNQIKVAAASGIDFFSFCWYYQPNKDIDKLNQALFFYHQSRNKSKLKFSLMVANHSGFIIGPKDWENVCDNLIQQFKDKDYVKIAGKPLVTFFSVSTLIKSFGSSRNVSLALNELRSRVKSQGLLGVNIAVCVNPDPHSIKVAKNCGFDILTGYNYHDEGYRSLVSKKKNARTYIDRTQPIDSLQSAEKKVWNKFLNSTALPYIPVVTLNWDKRPMANKTNDFAKAPYYTGYSQSSVYQSVKQGIEWVKQNSNSIPGNILMVYAWNENVEGAYLTPSKNGDNFLNGLKRAVIESKK